MASNRGIQGVKAFKAASHEELEALINEFISGDGSDEDPQRVIVHMTDLLIDSTDFYCMIYYQAV